MAIEMKTFSLVDSDLKKEIDATVQHMSNLKGLFMDKATDRVLLQCKIDMILNNLKNTRNKIISATIVTDVTPETLSSIEKDSNNLEQEYQHEDTQDHASIGEEEPSSDVDYTNADNSFANTPLHTQPNSNFDNDKIFQCEKCGKSFSSKVTLVIHRCKKKKKNTLFKCSYPQCLKSFKLEHNLKQHVSYAHSIKCPFWKCKKEFTSSQERDTHIATFHNRNVNPDIVVIKKTPPNIYKKCETCSIAFKRKAQYSLHNYLHKKFKSNHCRICHKIFTSRKSLAFHWNCHRALLADRGSIYCKKKECGKKFSLKALLIAHTNTKHSKKIQKCRLCQKSFSSLSAVIKHRRNACKISPRSTSCPQCHKHFSKPRKLMMHVRLHNRSRVYQCKICGKTFRFTSDLESHTEIHNVEKFYTCEVVGCGKSFFRLDSLDFHGRKCHTESMRSDAISHVKTSNCTDQSKKETSTAHVISHSGSMMFQCDLCSEFFSTKTAFKNHRKSHGEAEIPKAKVCCTLCSRKYKSKSALEYHLEHVHSSAESLPYMCGHCQKGFRSVEGLKRHQRLHTGEKPYNCETCNASFFNLTTLLRHKKYHGGKMYPCGSCDKKFPWKYELKKHMTVHTGERKYVCDVCGAAYYQNSHLRDHHQLHEGVDYQCDECGKTFIRSTALKRHKAMHKGIKDHVCPCCNKAFLKRYRLGQHIRSVHPEAYASFVEKNKGPRVRNTFLGDVNEPQFSSVRHQEDSVHETIYMTTTSTQSEDSKTVVLHNTDKLNETVIYIAAPNVQIKDEI